MKWNCRVFRVAIVAASVLAVALVADDRSSRSKSKAKNLVVNGDFEKASRGKNDRGRPDGWQHPDGLTSFWTQAPGRKGKCIKIDTDVLASQFRKREDEIAAALEKGRKMPPAPKRLPTRPPKYDTVAGIEGVHFVTEDIPIDPSKHYRLEVDVRVDGKGKPKVWIKGYAQIKSSSGTRTRIVWKKALDCAGADKEWATYSMVFPRNTRIPSRVDHVRVQLYPYWPPATYWFDNVRLTEISKAEREAWDIDKDHRRPAAGSKPASDKRKRGREQSERSRKGAGS